MSVDDHGIEALKKAAREVTPGNKSEYEIRVYNADITNSLADILEAIDGLEGFTDGLESLLTAISGSTDGLEGFTDGIEGLLTTGNTSLDNIETLLQSDFISGQIESPSDKTYTLDLFAIDQRTIDTITLKTTSGTCSAAVKIDGVSITGMSAISVSSVETTATATALNSVAIGQTLTLVISSSASPVDLVFTLKYRRNS